MITAMIMSFILGFLGISFLILFTDKQRIFLRIFGIMGFGLILTINVLFYIIANDATLLVSIYYPISMSVGIFVAIVLMAVLWKKVKKEGKQ